MFKKLLAALALLACCAGFLMLQGDHLVFSDVDGYTLQGPAYAKRDAQGNLYVMDAGRTRVLQVNAEGKLQQVWKAGANTFSDLDDLQVDAAGNVYVLDIVRLGGGRQIGEERVLRLVDGGAVEVLFSEAHTTDFLNRRIPQLLEWEGAPAFVMLEENTFTLMTPAADGWTATQYPFEDARTFFCAFAPMARAAFTAFRARAAYTAQAQTAAPCFTARPATRATCPGAYPPAPTAPCT